ncbi:MAG: aldehyde dehydrogenase family protein [Candidatus Hydrogenedentes bacterium]|nr:aldehyde dehydrogenase family protein [Candidatus Hydrogenedentota bacterium]
MTATIVKTNPRTGETLYTLQEPTPEALAATMERACAAAAVIKNMPVEARLDECRKLKRYLIAHKEDLVAGIVAENGKCVTDALIGDIFTCLDLITHYEKHAPKILQDEAVPTPTLLMGKKSKIMYCPLGPVLVISPWNYPLNTSLTPALCAFIAGNPVIIKPSEWTPMRGILDRVLTESGFLKDGIQVVFGGRETGQQLIDLRPAKIFFTGSVRGGKAILTQAAQHLIPVELELGGKDPLIVFEDANLERAVNGAVWGALNNTGQGCTSAERCFVHDSIFDTFVERLKEKFGALSTPDTKTEDGGALDMGCMTTPFQLDIVRTQVDAARAAGATVWQAYEPKQGSTTYPPTIVTKVTPGMAAQCEETFGPAITVVPFKTEAEAIALANDTPYGLSSSVWTRDLAKADRVARQIEAGNVCINDVMSSEGNTALPFGGVKQSGIGRYKGVVGLHTFCNMKSVMTDKGAKNAELNWYPYTPEKYQLFLKIVDVAFLGGLTGLLKLAPVGMKADSLVKKLSK